MNTNKLSHIFFTTVLTLIISACQQSTQSQTAQLDKLKEVQERGTLVVAIDPAYPPQSEIRPDATRAADTLCTLEQFTTGELGGFDVDVATEIAKRLDVEACFVAPNWLQIVRGNWQNQWDISVGSMAVTSERMESLYFSWPYYSTSATFFVHSDNTSYSNLSDLSGRKVGTCSGCTYQSYLEGTLDLPGQVIDFTVKDTEIMDYATETMALQELAWGDGVRLDAVLIASPTGAQAISNGLPVKQLGDPVYTEYLAAAVDKTGNAIAFVDKVTEIIQQLHSDGILRELSMQYYGEDLTKEASEFDISVLK